MTAPSVAPSTSPERTASSTPRTPAQPWHQRLLDLLPRWLYRHALRVEAAITDGVAAFAAGLPAGSLVLDAGAGQCQHRRSFAHCRYVGVDLAIGDPGWDYGKLDAVADLERLPFADASFAAALNIVVLEHTKDPAAVLRELARVLAPDGRLLLIAPQEWAVHQVPNDFFRFTNHGLRLLLERAGFGDLEIVPVGGLFSLLGRRLLDLVLFFQGGARWLLLPLWAAVTVPVGLLLPCLDVLDRERLTTLAYVVRARVTGRGRRS